MTTVRLELVSARRYYKNGAPGSVILGNGSPYLHTDTRTARRVFRELQSRRRNKQTPA